MKRSSDGVALSQSILQVFQCSFGEVALSPSAVQGV